jgi:hypothetical protein
MEMNKSIPILILLEWLVFPLFPITILGPSRVTKVLYNPGHTSKLDYLYCEKNFKYMPLNVRYLIEEGGGDHVRTSGIGPILIISDAKKYYTLSYEGKLDTKVPNIYYGFGIASDNYEIAYKANRERIQKYIVLIFLCIVGFILFVLLVITLKTS